MKTIQTKPDMKKIYKEHFPKMKAVIKDQWRNGKVSTVELDFNGEEGFFYANGVIYESQYEYYSGYTISEYELLELIIEDANNKN